MSNGNEKRTPIRSGGDGARIPVAIGGGEGGEEWSRDLKAEREEYEAAVRDLKFELARAKRGFFSRLGHTVESGLATAVNWVADGISSPANAPGPDDKTYERTSYLETAVGAAAGPVVGKVFAKVASKIGHALGREAADTAATAGFKRVDEAVDEVVDEVDHAGTGGDTPVPDPRQVEIAEEFASRAHHGDVPEPRDHGDVPHGAENLDEPGRIDELDPGLDPTWDPEGPWQFPAKRKGEWAGERGESDWTPHDPGAYGLERGDKIPFLEGVPDLSKWAVQTPSGQKGLLTVPGLSGEGDRALAIKQLAKQEGMSEPAVERWLKDNDLYIHHFGGNEVQIVPGRLHGALHHQGGASELRGRTPARIITPQSAGHDDDAPPPPPPAPPPLPAQRLAAVFSRLGIDLALPQRTASDDADDGTEPQPAMTDPPPAVPAREAPSTLPPPQPPGGAQMSYPDDDDRESDENREGDEQSSRRDDGEGEGQTRPPRDEREDEERDEEQVSHPDGGKREAQAEEEVSYPDDGEREAQAEEQVSYPDDLQAQAEEQVSYAEDGGGQGDGYDGGAVAAAGP